MRLGIAVGNACLDLALMHGDTVLSSSKRPTTGLLTSDLRTGLESLPHLRESDHAAIVNVCSIAALNGLPQRAVYSASKGAILALTFAMATDHVAEGVRVNCVSPGTVSTPFVDRMLQGFPDPVTRNANRHFGLIEMRERAETAGGWWAVASSPGTGANVRFWLPNPPSGDGGGA